MAREFFSNLGAALDALYRGEQPTADGYVSLGLATHLSATVIAALMCVITNFVPDAVDFVALGVVIGLVMIAFSSYLSAAFHDRDDS